MSVLSLNDDKYHMGHLFMEYIKMRPKAICQIDAATGEQETNESVLHRSVRLARCFRKLGLQPGDVLALGGLNHLDLHIPYYAGLMNGLPIAGVDPLYKFDEIITHFKFSRPKVAFCQKENFEEYKEASRILGLNTIVKTFDGENCMKEFINEYDDDAPIDNFEPAIFDLDKVYAWLVSTGGTMGKFKLAAIKHKAFIHKYVDYFLQMSKKHNESKNGVRGIRLILSPVHWIAPFVYAIGIILMDCTKLHTSLSPTTDHVIDIINKYKPATTVITPPIVTSILRHEKKCDLTCFDTVAIGGAKLHNEILIELRKLTRDPKIVFEVYGQTENFGMIFTPNPLGPIGTCGKSTPSVLVKIVDRDTGREITEPNIPGELWTKTECFTEYYNNPEETALSFSEDGYFKTGDIFYRDEEDNYFFVERLKMLIKYRSYHITPPELEDVIRTHPAVKDVSVVGLPHLEDGEWPVACVVLENGIKVTAKEIEDLVADKLSDSKRLRGGVIFMDELPLTSVAKLARAKLRQMVIDIKNKY